MNEHALTVIGVCDDWWSSRIIDDFHKRTNLNGENIELSRLGFPKRACSDDANLCEVISIAPEETDEAEEFIDKLFKENRFDVRYREQLEKTSATGTVGAYLYLANADYYDDGSVRGGAIRINYVDADCIIPLTVENHLVTECAFGVTNMVKGKERTTLTIFTMDEHGRYSGETVIFNERGEEQPDEHNIITLGDVKPFSIMQNAEVNNLDNMEGYGLPKIYGCIPFFKAADLCYNILYGDLGNGDKLVFINELLSCISRDNDGNPMLTPQQKKLFILLGEKLPNQDNLVKEYNPEIRTAQITEAFELVLSLISLSFGYGTKKYTFENGQITTATEYIGERQDAMQELNRQRKNATDYIEDIIKASLWFSNQFHGTTFNLDEEFNIEFDDSYIEDKQTKLENMRNDATSFPEIPWLLVQYLMERYNLPEEEAQELVDNRKDPYSDDDLTDDGEVEEEDDEEDDIDLDALLKELEE